MALAVHFGFDGWLINIEQYETPLIFNHKESMEIES